jgi:hypothetical protein
MQLRRDISGFSECLLSIASTFLGLLLAKLPSTRDWKNILKAFFSKTLRFILRFLYLWVAYFSGDTRKEELAKLVYLQREQASKSLIIN